MRPLAKDIQEKKSGIWTELKVVKKDVETREKDIEVLRKEMEVIKESQSDVKEQADAITEDIEKHSDQITQLFQKKDSLRDEYWKARWDFDLQRD